MNFVTIIVTFLECSFDLPLQNDGSATLAPSTEEFPHVHFKCDIKFDQIYFFPFCLRWKFELLQLQK